MRREQLYPPARFCNSVKLADKSHHIRHVLDDVAGDDEIEFVISKRIWKFTEIVNYISRRVRIIIETDRTFGFIRSAPDIEDLHCSYIYHIER